MSSPTITHHFTSLDQARRELKNFLRLADWSKPGACQSISNFIYSTLQQYPELAGEEYWRTSRCHPIEGTPAFRLLRMERIQYAFPLVHLLLVRAPLNVLQDIYHMHPPALLDHKELLFTAIQYRNSAKVIETLLSKNPEALFQTDASGNNLLHLALTAIDTSNPAHYLERIEFLANASPEGILQCNSHADHHLSPLATVFHHCNWIPDSVIDVLVKKLPRTNNLPLRLQNDFRPKQQSKRLPRYIGRLQQQLTRSQTIPLHFVSCQLTTHTLDELVQVLSTCTPTLTFQKCNIQLSGGDPTMLPIPLNWKSTPLQKVTVDCCKISLPVLGWLVLGLSTVATLKELKCIYSKKKQSTCTEETDLTDIIVKLLRASQQQQQQLEYLLLCGLSSHVDAPQILKVLSNEQTTMTGPYVEYYYHPESNTSNAGHCYPQETLHLEIGYYSALNHYGHKATQTTPNGASKTSVVEWVTSLQQDGSKLDDRLKSMVLYGLLRTNPSLWA